MSVPNQKLVLSILNDEQLISARWNQNSPFPTPVKVRD
jgi:hypothetical protein